MFQNKTLRELLLVAGLWLTASAAQAGPQPGPAMPVGGHSLAPPGYLDFCMRKPLDCGADRGLVLAQAAQATQERADLIARYLPGATPATLHTGSLTPTPQRTDPEASLAPAWGELEPVSTVSVETITRVEVAVSARFIDASQDMAPAVRRAELRVTPRLWSLLSRVNGEVNHAITEQPDIKTYGVEDYWNTPLEDGRRFGDCEDYVLEKERALLAAGLPRAALNIAVVLTRWGEGHAVLLVSTNEGEYVLDSLSPVVTPWREAPYRWVKRQVNGEPFNWVMIDEPAPAQPKTPRLLIALAR